VPLHHFLTGPLLAACSVQAALVFAGGVPTVLAAPSPVFSFVFPSDAISFLFQPAALPSISFFPLGRLPHSFFLRSFVDVPTDVPVSRDPRSPPYEDPPRRRSVSSACVWLCPSRPYLPKKVETQLTSSPLGSRFRPPPFPICARPSLCEYRLPFSV